MSWWARSHASLAAATLILVAVVAVPLVGSSAMPVLRIGFGPAPFVILLPAIAATGLLGLVQGGSPTYEALSVRPTGLLSRLLVGLACLAVSLVWAVCGALTSDAGLALLAARNLAGYLGVALITLRIAGGLLGNAAPLVYAVVVAVLGSASAGGWSWPLHAASSASALAVVAVLFVGGVTVGVGRGALRVAALRAE